jgi:YihY family inner membrane protein
MKFKEAFQKALAWIKNLYHRLDDLSGGVLGIIRLTIERFTEERGAETAASLAYYAFFSIFPMLLVFIVIGSFFVDAEVVQIQLLTVLEGIVPAAEDLVIQNINHVLRLRGAVTFVALLSLVWSATSVFNILARNINRAFPQAGLLNFFKGRLRALVIFFSIGLLLLLSLAVSTLIGLIPVIEIPINGFYLHETIIWQIGGFLVPVFVNWIMFGALYQWVPTVDVSRRASFFGGLIAAVAWVLLNNGFTWYLSSGLSQYQLVYGSLGTIVALFFWVYLTAIIVLVGAHLTAAIQTSRQRLSDD